MSVRRGSNSLRQYILHDVDIRANLISYLLKSYVGDCSTRILEEFGICEGNVRIDLAVVNGTLNGFEIKSDSDTLERLPLQQEIYSKVFDTVVIVAGKTHCEKIEAIVPDWWGIWAAEKEVSGIRFTILREGNLNHNVDPESLVQCLWRDEALAILKENHLDEGLQKARRSMIWDQLVQKIACHDLKQYVYSSLKSRENWNIVLSQG
jgi:hypothetical protein